MAHKYTLVIRQKFKQSYHEQYTWSLNHHGVRITDQYFKSVNLAVEGLMSTPKLHRKLKNGLRMLPVKSAYILYKINEDKKEIEIIDFIAQHRVYEFSQEP